VTRLGALVDDCYPQATVSVQGRAVSFCTNQKWLVGLIRGTDPHGMNLRSASATRLMRISNMVGDL
jgi:hypothetical protein